MRKESILLLLIGILSFPTYVFAQETPTVPLEKFYGDRDGYPFRKLLKNVKFSLSTGAGSTNFKHKLTGFGVYQTSNIGPYIFAGNSIPTNGHAQWIDTNVYDTIVNAASGFLVSSDTSKLGFKSKSFTVPFTGTVHYELKNFRIGLGYSKDLIFLSQFKPSSYGETIRPAKTLAGSVWTSKILLMGGYTFYRFDSFVFTGDFRGGTNKFGRSFNTGIIKPSLLFFNVGVTIEKELSEYLRLFVRPGFEFKSYTISLAESNLSIKHKSNALLFNVGLSYSIPELPKCKVKVCRIQMNHAHGNKEFRSRAHAFYEKQNPGYGENDPKLIRDKWRNRKKINPY